MMKIIYAVLLLGLSNLAATDVTVGSNALIVPIGQNLDRPTEVIYSKGNQKASNGSGLVILGDRKFIPFQEAKAFELHESIVIDPHGKVYRGALYGTYFQLDESHLLSENAVRAYHSVLSICGFMENTAKQLLENSHDKMPKSLDRTFRIFGNYRLIVALFKKCAPYNYFDHAPDKENLGSNREDTNVATWVNFCLLIYVEKEKLTLRESIWANDPNPADLLLM